MRAAAVIAALLAATASAYSVKTIKTLYDGLHESSVEDVFDGTLAKTTGVADASAALEKAWSSGLGASVAAATKKKPEECTALKTAKGKISPCAEPLLASMMKGAAEPDNAPCPDTYDGASMTTQLFWAPYAAINPLGPCRSGIQPYHGSPPPLVHFDGLGKTVLGDAHAVSPTGVVTLPRPKDTMNRLNAPPMAAAVDNTQWRSNVVARIAHLAAVAALAPSPVAGAKKLGAAFHVLGDSFSASHVQRFDDPAAAEAAVKGTTAKAYAGPIDGSKELYYGSIEACSAGLAVEQSFSMDVVRWTKHFGADVDRGDKKSIHAARLYRCMELFVQRIVEEWMTVRAEGSGGAGAVVVSPPKFRAVDRKRLGRRHRRASSKAEVVHAAGDASEVGAVTLDRVNRFVDTVIDVACAALRFPGEHEGKAKDYLHAPAGGANVEFSSAAKKAFHDGRSMQPAGVIAEADFVDVRNKWDEEIQVLRDHTKAAAQINVPSRYWLPNRGQDACALPHTHSDPNAPGGQKETNAFRQQLLVTADEFKLWSTGAFEEAVDKDGGYLLPPRDFMLKDLKPALTDRASGRYTLAAHRIAGNVDALKKYRTLTEEEKLHASKDELAEAQKEHDGHGIGE